MTRRAPKVVRAVTVFASQARRIQPVDTLFRALGRTLTRDLSQMSAGIAYFAILSLFPLLMAAVGVASLFFDQDFVTQQLSDFLSRYIPVSVDVIDKNVEEVARLRGTLSGFSLLLLLWSGSGLFGALSRVVNRVWGIDEGRPFYREKLRQFSMLLLAVALFAFSIATTVFLQFARSFEFPALGGQELWQHGVVQFSVDAAALLFTSVTFLLLYRFLPNERVTAREIWPGAVVGALLFELLKAGFITYLRNFSNPQLIYGSLSSIILVLLWFHASAYILIFGAALSAEYRLGRRKSVRRPAKRE